MAGKGRRIPLQAKRLGIALMLQGRTDSSIADELKVHRFTIARWRKDPKFVAMLNQVAEHALAASEARFLDLAEKSLKAVEEVLDDPDDDRALLAAAEIVFKRLGIDQRLAARAKAAEAQSAADQAAFNAAVDALAAERAQAIVAAKVAEALAARDGAPPDPPNH